MDRGLRSGETSLTDYLAELEERCGEIEPTILSLMEEPDRFDRLRREAAELEARWPDPAERPLLFGVPIGVKDIFRVDGFPTTAGSRLPVEVFQGDEATVVSELKAAGALILGKTVSTEFAYFGPGPTRNPHARDRTPGGSSSGSAAALAAGLTPLALGTQTIGSISRPASFCGVVGYKPSYDRIAREGVIPLSPSLDHVGLFAAGVADAELGASLLCSEWRPKDLDAKPTLAVPKGPLLKRAEREGLYYFKSVCDRLEAAGFTVRVVAVMPDFEEIEARHRLIVAAEAARVHTAWFGDYGALYHPKTVELLERGQGVSQAALGEALTGRETLRGELTAAMGEKQIDLWISPAAPGVAPVGLDSTGDPVMNLPWTHCGLPTLAIPAGANEEGLPLGLQVAARWREDEALMRWGKMIEEALRES